MPGDRIHIDEQVLRRNVLAYLRSPAGRRVVAWFEPSITMAVLATVVMCGLGLCLLPTVIGTRSGLRILWNVVTLKAFSSSGREVQGDLEKLRPLIAHSIMIGPTGRYALALGSFSPTTARSADWLAQKAASLASVHIGDDAWEGAEHTALRDLLRDDVFRRNRRRRLPEPYAEGHNVLLFDVDLFVFDENISGRCDCQATGASVLMAFVANYGKQELNGESGEIHAIPWSVVNEAVHISSSPGLT